MCSPILIMAHHLGLPSYDRPECEQVGGTPSAGPEVGGTTRAGTASHLTGNSLADGKSDCGALYRDE